MAWDQAGIRTAAEYGLDWVSLIAQQPAPSRFGLRAGLVAGGGVADLLSARDLKRLARGTERVATCLAPPGRGGVESRAALRAEPAAAPLSPATHHPGLGWPAPKCGGVGKPPCACAFCGRPGNVRW